MYNVWLLEKACMSAGFLVQTPHDFKINLWGKKEKKKKKVRECVMPKKENVT